ncbi:hypothetical protein A3K93_04935 [Acinetobacter sp. NCu2D-2]|uniref:VIT1/CCC1 transporter family protein n=1 Tax=Acinetobacter sp. NCu2D-2 TaxID=1608473 RepID=UPI0007CDC4DC|nr:VIT family protein [Acinetobacter sp. NCu2D-2]ANF81589.1 hypothetical protein A3K93_04935 [Acinetobacter sp. NCu2D-2]
MSYSAHSEPHYITRAGWLRAAVLGANDGIISVTSLVVGMAASGASTHTLFITCVAGLIAGATSMAAGEYISVKSQEDIEEADLKMEHHALQQYPEAELRELTKIYMLRGLDENLAHQVAVQLSAHNALEAHARDEIGIHENTTANALQAAGSSALAFSIGALFPMLSILFSPEVWLKYSVMLIGVLSLGLLGAVASYYSGTSKLKGALRVMFWGMIAMAFSAWIGSFFNISQT